jgi:hypothetical protein
MAPIRVDLSVDCDGGNDDGDDDGDDDDDGDGDDGDGDDGSDGGGGGIKSLVHIYSSLLLISSNNISFSSPCAYPTPI